MHSVELKLSVVHIHHDHSPLGWYGVLSDEPVHVKIFVFFIIFHKDFSQKLLVLAGVKYHLVK